MATSTRTVANLVGFDEGSGDAPATLRLGDGTTRRVSRDSRYFALLAGWCRKSRGTPVYLESDATTGEVTLVAPSMEWRVERVATEPVDGWLQVDLYISAARHRLSVAHPDFDALRRCLEDAARERAPVLVSEDPRTFAIVDVRRPLAPAAAS